MEREGDGEIGSEGEEESEGGESEKRKREKTTKEVVQVELRTVESVPTVKYLSEQTLIYFRPCFLNKKKMKIPV